MGAKPTFKFQRMLQVASPLCRVRTGVISLGYRRDALKGCTELPGNAIARSKGKKKKELDLSRGRFLVKRSNLN